MIFHVAAIAPRSYAVLCHVMGTVFASAHAIIRDNNLIFVDGSLHGCFSPVSFKRIDKVRSELSYFDNQEIGMTGILLVWNQLRLLIL